MPASAAVQGWRGCFSSPGLSRREARKQNPKTCQATGVIRARWGSQLAVRGKILAARGKTKRDERARALVVNCTAGCVCACVCVCVCVCVLQARTEVRAHSRQYGWLLGSTKTSNQIQYLPASAAQASAKPQQPQQCPAQASCSEGHLALGSVSNHARLSGVMYSSQNSLRSSAPAHSLARGYS